MSTTTERSSRTAGVTRTARPTLANYWHPIARSEDVVEQPKQFELLGDKICAFRTVDGVSAFKDLCIHRGTALSLGWVTDGRITCAYHGWEYDSTGRCVKIPSLPEGSTIPRKARAIAYRAEERYGLVWVAMEEPVAPIPAFPHDEWDDPVFRGFLSSTYVWSSSAGRSVENFMDVSHFPFVHENLLGTRDQTVVAETNVVETDHGLYYMYEQEEPNELYGGGTHVTRWEYHLYTPFTIHLTKTTGAEKTIISLVSAPTTPKLTHMYLFITRNYRLDEDDRTFKDFSDVIMDQDRVIVESQRPEEIPTDLREELHLKVPDASGIAYRRLLGRIDQAGAFMP
ncbi:MAG TPA: aromatic ring-hydroxylating dioxygenase subunit alpha [Gaiellaceae bacterium]|nr:aromatic ring-hydroxylating dioxygenase subunit alpha [Gaiellaceae bacterium]